MTLTFTSGILDSSAEINEVTYFGGGVSVELESTSDFRQFRVPRVYLWINIDYVEPWKTPVLMGR